MKTIRSNCFETNSSSTHSVTISKEKSIVKDFGGLEIYCGEFGWEWKKYNDFKTKASYIWTLISVHNCQTAVGEHLRELSEEYNFKLVAPKDKEWFYVDHGWEHFEKFEINTKNDLKNFLFSEKSWLFLGNDNGYAPPNFHLTVEKKALCDKCLCIENEEPVYFNSKETNVTDLIYESVFRKFYEMYSYEYYQEITKIEDSHIEYEVQIFDYTERKKKVVSTRTLKYEIKDCE